MISFDVILAFVIAAICTLILPIVLIIVLAVKKSIKLIPLLVGAAAFFVSQILLRIPLISVLSTQQWYQDFSFQFIPYALVLCFTAGLFEESGRLGGALILKKNRTFRDIMSFGLGHGLCEVVILIGITHISNIVLCIVISSGYISSMIPGEMTDTIIEQMMSVRAFDIYLGIVERISAVIFHMFATLLVFHAVIHKKWQYYLYAIAAHTAFNMVAVVINRYTNALVTEIALLLLAAACGLYILRYRKESSEIE